VVLKTTTDLQFLASEVPHQSMLLFSQERCHAPK
jgi:hypothetical protein